MRDAFKFNDFTNDELWVLLKWVEMGKSVNQQRSGQKKLHFSKKNLECKQMFKTINGNNKCKLTSALSQVKKLHDVE
jgi:hypothetical protein